MILDFLTLSAFSYTSDRSLACAKTGSKNFLISSGVRAERSEGLRGLKRKKEREREREVINDKETMLSHQHEHLTCEMSS